MVEGRRDVDWFVVAVNAVMWAVAVFVAWTQIVGWDGLVSRFSAFFGGIAALLRRRGPGICDPL